VARWPGCQMSSSGAMGDRHVGQGVRQSFARRSTGGSARYISYASVTNNPRSAHRDGGCLAPARAAYTRSVDRRRLGVECGRAAAARLDTADQTRARSTITEVK